MLNMVTTNDIHLGCKAANKVQVLSMISQACEEKGYVNQDCSIFFQEREKQVSTFLGNGITLPHLPKSANSIIIKTGIEIFQFPDGVIWDRNNVMFIAIGVVAKEKEHIEILKSVASVFSDEIISNALALLSNKQDFLRILNQEQ